MVLGPKPMGEPTTWIYKKKKKFEFRKIGYLIKMPGYFSHGLNTVKG